MARDLRRGQRRDSWAGCLLQLHGDPPTPLMSKLATGRLLVPSKWLHTLAAMQPVAGGWRSALPRLWLPLGSYDPATQLPRRQRQQPARQEILIKTLYTTHWLSGLKVGRHLGSRPRGSGLLLQLAYPASSPRVRIGPSTQINATKCNGYLGESNRLL